MGSSFCKTGNKEERLPFANFGAEVRSSVNNNQAPGGTPSPRPVTQKTTCVAAVYVVVIVLIFIVIFAGSWIAIIDLYGYSKCSESDRTPPMCYCNHFDTKWSCLSDSELATDENYCKGYYKLFHWNRFHLYFAWSIFDNVCLTVAAASLLLRCWHYGYG